MLDRDQECQRTGLGTNGSNLKRPDKDACIVDGPVGVPKLACSMQLMIISFLLKLQAALTNLCLMLLAGLPQALTLSQKRLPAGTSRTPHCAPSFAQAIAHMAA